MSDDARTTAFNDAAPADERFQAQAELNRIYKPLASQLMPADAVQDVISFINGQLEDRAMMMKAASGNVVPFPGRYRAEPKEGMRSVFLDDFQVWAHGDYFERPSAMGFDQLRHMVEQTPILTSVVMTRQRQVARFCGPSEDGGPGFEIKHRDREHQASAGEKKAMQELAGFFQNCGWETKPRLRKKLKRDSFAQFMQRSVKDSLTFDACPIELEWKRDQRQGLDGFYAVDGTTVRLCTEEGYQGDDEIFALQVVQGRIATAYTHDQLVYEVRNGAADVRRGGYGQGETELLIRIVTGWLNALTYNTSGFDQNAIPKGLLHLTGDYSKEDLAAFKRYWNAAVKGVNNSWSLPMLVSKDQESKAAFERFGIEFNEMYFSKWMTFLTSIVCAVYGMDPTEINFESFTSGKSSLSGDDTAERLAAAKDKGLRPFLSFYENLFTDFFVAEFDPQFCFRWTGLDERDKAQEWEGKKLTLTVDELRAEQGYEPHPDEQLGTAPLNPSLIGPWMQLNQAPAPGGDFGGGPGPDFGQPDGDGGAGEGAPSQDGGPDERGPQGGQEDAQAPEAKKPGGAGDFGGAGQGDFGKALPLIYAIEAG